jgi:hypothetical protein
MAKTQNAIPFAPFQLLLWVVLPSAGSCDTNTHAHTSRHTYIPGPEVTAFPNKVKKNPAYTVGAFRGERKSLGNNLNLVCYANFPHSRSLDCYANFPHSRSLVCYANFPHSRSLDCYANFPHSRSLVCYANFPHSRSLVSMLTSHILEV